MTWYDDGGNTPPHEPSLEQAKKVTSQFRRAIPNRAAEKSVEGRDQNAPGSSREAPWPDTGTPLHATRNRAAIDSGLRLRIYREGYEDGYRDGKAAT